ncbi:ATP-grasp domain-containing protein [Chloroflexota bacterium]
MTLPEKRIKIGFVYDSPVEKEATGAESVASEYEDSRTIDWMYGCLNGLGEVVKLPWSKGNLVELLRADVDVIFNITEASGGRNRESLVPAIAETLGIPCTGTDAVGLGLSLDKYLTKVIADYNGIPTPAFLRINELTELDLKRAEIEAIGYPLFLKPVTGGSSQGIRQTARVESYPALRDEAEWIIRSCRDDVLIEKFIPGREFTCGLIETDSLKSFPVAELLIGEGKPEDFYSYEMKSVHRKETVCPADIPEEISLQMEDYSRRLFRLLGCRDLARVDYRQGEDGVPYLIEINPLPGLSPFYSVFITQAEAGGISPEKVIEILINNALSRRESRLKG